MLEYLYRIVQSIFTLRETADQSIGVLLLLACASSVVEDVDTLRKSEDIGLVHDDCEERSAVSEWSILWYWRGLEEREGMWRNGTDRGVIEHKSQSE